MQTINYFTDDWVTIREIYEVILEDKTKYSTIDKLVREIEKYQDNELINKGEKVEKNNKNRKLVNIKGLDMILEKIIGIDINNIKEEKEDGIVTYHLDNYKIMRNIEKELQKYTSNIDDINLENIRENINNLENYYKMIIKNKEKHIRDLDNRFLIELTALEDQYDHEKEILNLKLDNLTELLKSSRELNEAYKKERDYFKNLNE
ncbi:hypothetical protein WL281_12535 [Staphylococcus epidermidis]|uniref:hypothetical protein n=1 Tax=Staphylococcus epidermidis TaxID=1282 RepID=UPI0001A96319|nr:hypothetical protein [Staphylococcus epidermidis]EES37021.1 hypothetical protein HMPREF0791_0364 [Staphylococcus epidermidis W23144]